MQVVDSQKQDSIKFKKQAQFTFLSQNHLQFTLVLQYTQNTKGSSGSIKGRGGKRTLLFNELTLAAPFDNDAFKGQRGFGPQFEPLFHNYTTSQLEQEFFLFCKVLEFYLVVQYMTTCILHGEKLCCRLILFCHQSCLLHFASVWNSNWVFLGRNSAKVLLLLLGFPKFL